MTHAQCFPMVNRMAGLCSFPLPIFSSSTVFFFLFCVSTIFPDAASKGGRGGGSRGKSSGISRIGAGRLAGGGAVRSSGSYFASWITDQRLSGSQLDAVILLSFVVLAIAVAILGYYCHQKHVKASQESRLTEAEKHSSLIHNKPPSYSPSASLNTHTPSSRTPLLDRTAYGDYSTYAETQPLFSYPLNNWENEEKSHYNYCSYASSAKTDGEGATFPFSSEENQRNNQERPPNTPRRILPSIPPLYSTYCSPQEQTHHPGGGVRRLLPRIPLVYVPYTSHYSERVPRRLLPRTPPPTYSSIFLDNSIPPPSYASAMESQYYENNQCILKK